MRALVKSTIRANKSPDEIKLISEALVKTGDLIARLMMSYAGFAAFCVFTLLSPDLLMIESQASLNVPIAGNVSFLAFMIVAPTFLIGTRIYLEIYVSRWRALDKDLPAVAKPRTISPLKHPVLSVFSAVVLYLLLPALLALFTWKVAAKDVWGDAFLCLTVIAIVVQILLLMGARDVLLGAFTTMAVLVGLTIIAAGGIIPHRGLYLYRADLKGAYLWGEDFREAFLAAADLTGANLRGANLTRAFLITTKLSKANIQNAHLTEAKLGFADLTGANLRYATLTGANLTEADLTGADLTEADLAGAFLGLTDLNEADLTGADLSYVDLIGANLRNANLRNANLLDVKSLTQEQLEIVRSSPPPKFLPKDLTWPYVEKNGEWLRKE